MSELRELDEFNDFVECCNCGRIGYVERCADVCPKCLVEGCLKDLDDTDLAKIITDLQKENADLRAKLAAAIEDNETILNAAENSNSELVSAIAKHWRGSNDRLRAHNALLVGAIKKLLPYAEAWSDDGSAIVLAEQALSTTPSEAYERVQGLIDAVKSIADIKIDAKYDKCNRPLLYGIVVTCRAALQRYRGEGNG